MGNTKAHAGKPASGQQSHHKLSTLDPLVARNELLDKNADPVARAKALTEDAGNASEQPMAPRRGLSKLKSKLLKGVKGAAKALGISHGKPIAQKELLRYAGTTLKPDVPGGVNLMDSDVPQRIISAFATSLAAEQDALDARIAVNEAVAARGLMAAHLGRMESDIELSATRAGNMANWISRLTQEAIDTAAELATLRYSIESTDGIHATTQAVLARKREALAEEQQALRNLIDMTPHRHLADFVKQTRRQKDGTYSLGGLIRKDREKKIASLTEYVTQLEEVEAQGRESLSAMRAKVQELEHRQKEIDRKVKQARQSARVNERAIWDDGDAAREVQVLQEPLQQVVQEREVAKAAAQAICSEALESYAEVDRACCDQLLQTCPGFENAADLQPLREAIHAWSDTLGARLARFAAEALPKSMAMNIAFEALSVATGGDPQRAAEVVRELGTKVLADLVPPSGALNEGVNKPSEQAQRLARILADEGSGMQLLELLLAPSDVRIGSVQAEAARQYLLADEARRRAPKGNNALRDWIASAQRAAGRTAHAADPSQTLADCTIDERAAYRAFCNGYDSNAPGSNYDKANQYLKKLAQWLKNSPDVSCLSLFEPVSPLDALHEGLILGAAMALPTPARQAAKALEEAAAHLNDYLAARRQLLGPGHVPSCGELAWQAIANRVQWHPEGTDLTSMKLDRKAIHAIEQRRQDLQRQFENEARLKTGGQVMASAVNPPLDAAWKELQGGKKTVLEALNRVHQLLPASEPAPPGCETDTPDMAHWRKQEAVLRTRVHDAVERANRLLHDGNPARVTSAKALFDLSRDMIENLEWRDRLRLMGQRVRGVSAGPLSAALSAAGMTTGVGVKAIAGLQQSKDEVMEIYMGRTGLYLQIGEQTTRQGQAGAGVNCGNAWSLCDVEDGARVGVGGTADWKIKHEKGIESGVQLRVLRLSKGQEPKLMAQFMDMYEHLLTLTAAHESDEPAPDDWMRELLAHHSNVNVGLIDGAMRENTSTETNTFFFAGLRLGKVDKRPRRVNLSISLGGKTKRDQSRTQTEVAGRMTTLYRDSTAQAKVEVNVRASAGVQLHGWKKDDDTPMGRSQQKASISTSGLDLSYAAEIRAKGLTHFCTLFTIDKKIDPVRSDCAMDFLDFSDFEREVRREWSSWVNYGSTRLPEDMGEGMRYAVAERQLENLLDQARLFAKHNKFATVYMDKALKHKVAPILDGLRALASLQRKAGREQSAKASERRFDDFIAQPELWEPTILILREKAKRQAERGIDFIGKCQRNRIAEAMRTVGQWPLYEPVPRAEPGQKPEPARLWRSSVPAAQPPLQA